MGGHDHYDFPRQATHEEMSAAELPLAVRDRCALLLIELNQ